MRPVGIDEHRVPGELQEKRRVADPGDAHLVGFGCCQHGVERIARSALEQARDDAVAQETEIACGPAFVWEEAGISVVKPAVWYGRGRFHRYASVADARPSCMGNLRVATDSAKSFLRKRYVKSSKAFDDFTKFSITNFAIFK